MKKPARIAIFAGVTVKLWITSPAVATDKQERSEHDTQKNTGFRSDQEK